MMKPPNRFLLCLSLLLLLPLVASAQGERMRFGEDIVVEEDETLDEVVCIGCSIRVLGRVSHEVVAVGGDVEIEGSVGQDAVAVFGGIELLPGASVGHDAVAVFGEVERDATATVGGETISPLPLPVAGMAGLILFLLVLSFLVHLILVFITFLIAGERRMDVVAETIRVRPGASLLAGLGIMVAAVILFILAAWMGPVAPIVAVIVAVALGITLIVGYTGLCYWMGRLLVKHGAGLVAVLVGVLLVTLLQFVPFVTLVFSLLALGCAALSGFGQHPDWLPQQLGGQAAATHPPPAG